MTQTDGSSPRPRGAGGIWLESVRIRGDSFPNLSAYPFSVRALQHFQELVFTQPVAFLVGENGSGKSTLLEAIARRCGFHLWAQPRRSRLASANPGKAASSAAGPIPADAPVVCGDATGGVSSARRLPGFPAWALSDYLDVKLARASVRGGVFSAESFREWAEFIDDVTAVDPGQARYHGGEQLTLRSRGEGLLAYFRGRYQIPGLYFLDEPEAALSPASQLELLRLLSEYRRRGHAQFVVATHSPILMAVRGAQIFALGDGPIDETSYEATSHYRLYREFMADPEKFAAD